MLSLIYYGHQTERYATQHNATHFYCDKYNIYNISIELAQLKKKETEMATRTNNKYQLIK